MHGIETHSGILDRHILVIDLSSRECGVTSVGAESLGPSVTVK
jgi:hypothetical protein